jgi:hypothetical protein
MQQLWFINNPLAQHVSGIIISIFRSARPYITAYGFQHLMWWLVSWGTGKQAVCTVYAVHSAHETLGWLLPVGYFSTMCQLSDQSQHTDLVPGCWYVLSPTRKETSSEACPGRTRFQQHGTRAVIIFFSWKARRRRKFTPFWQKH